MIKRALQLVAFALLFRNLGRKRQNFNTRHHTHIRRGAITTMLLLFQAIVDSLMQIIIVILIRGSTS